MEFSEWLSLDEGKFFQLSDDVIDQIAGLVKKQGTLNYKQIIDSLYKDEIKGYTLGHVKISNQDIIPVIFGRRDIWGFKGLAAFFPGQKKVVIDPEIYTSHGRNDIRGTIAHELGHAEDPKIQKGIAHSEKYTKWYKTRDPKLRRHYMNDPAEFDAVSGEIVLYLKM